MRKTFISILTAYLISVIAGFISIFILLLLFIDYYGNANELFFPIIGRTFLSFFLSFILCVTVFFPISIMDKTVIQKSSREELIKRYLPIITLPLSILFCMALFSDGNQSDHYFFITALLTTFCQSYVGLWVFIKQIKS